MSEEIVVPGLAPIGFVYDGRGRLTGMSQGSRTTTLGYDARNRLTTTTDTLDRTVSYEYDDADRVTRQTLPDGRFIGFTYDDKGNLTSVTPPSRPQHAFTMNAVDLAATYTPPAAAPGGPTHYDYNLDRQLTLVTRPDSKTIAFGYDGGGRMSSLTIGGGAYTFDYDASSGHLQSAETPEGDGITYRYDGALLTQATWTGAVTGSISWQYDDSFRIVAENVACTTPALACQEVMFSYDDDDLLIGAGPLGLQRDSANGRPAGSLVGSVSDAWTYNAAGEPVTYTAEYEGSPVFAQQYARDEAGRITERTETIAGATSALAYTYDDMGRPSTVVKDGVLTAGYTYDENGNRVTKNGPGGPDSATYDDQDRMLTYNDATYLYSANGELLSKNAPNGTTTYEYDELGNLLKVVLPDGRVIEYIIDGENRRVGKKIDGLLVQRWIYSGELSPTAELDGNGNVVARFIYATRGNVPDLIVKNDIIYRVLSDHLGSLRLIVDTSTGAQVQQATFDEYGNVSSDTNPGFQPFGFAGGFYDVDTGLLRFGARDYDPHTGRFMTKDPIGFAGGDANLYAYVMNDPINLVDPMGTDWVETTATISAGVGDGILETLSFGLWDG